MLGVPLVVGSNDTVRQGVRFIGERGWVHITRSRTTTEPASLVRDVIGPNEIHLYTCAGGEIRNFLDCVKSRKPCYAPAEYGHRAAGIAHLGNIAMMIGRKLKWDPEKEIFPGDDEANRMRSRPMREPWSL